MVDENGYNSPLSLLTAGKRFSTFVFLIDDSRVLRRNFFGEGLFYFDVNSSFHALPAGEGGGVQRFKYEEAKK